MYDPLGADTMSIHSLAVLGGDLRQCYLAEYMRASGHKLSCFGIMPFSFSEENFPAKANSLTDALSDTALILGPVPFSVKKGFLSTDPLLSVQITLQELLDALIPGQILAGGSIPDEFCRSCAEKQILVLDLLQDEDFLQKNAVLTAEGLLASLIHETPFSLMGRRVLLLGYGRCGQAIGRLLLPFDMEILVLEQEESRRLLARLDGMAAMAPVILPQDLLSFDLVINTIPAQVLTSTQLEQLPKHCIIFDIASAPFGFQPKSTDGRRLVRCPGIPGKMMPETSGTLIGKIISERLLSHGF